MYQTKPLKTVSFSLESYEQKHTHNKKDTKSGAEAETQKARSVALSKIPNTLTTEFISVLMKIRTL
jgi:hypothetical protein